jgi:hypothetical protein
MEGQWELLPISQMTFCLILVSCLLISLIILLIGLGLPLSGPMAVITKTNVEFVRVVVFRV